MFLLYYRPGCPHSINSDNVMNTLSLPHTTIKIESNNLVIKKQLNNIFNHNTFPAVIYYDKLEDTNNLSSDIPSNGIFIGGNKEFTELIDTVNTLDKNNIKKKYNKLSNKDVSYRDFLYISNYILLNKNKK